MQQGRYYYPAEEAVRAAGEVLLSVLNKVVEVSVGRGGERRPHVPMSVVSCGLFIVLQSAGRDGDTTVVITEADSCGNLKRLC